MAHFAVDESDVRFCTHLKGKTSWFLPFNRGWNDGAGNPPNPRGIKTDYLWREVLTRESLTDILENYARRQFVRSGGERTQPKTVAGRRGTGRQRGRGVAASGRTPDSMRVISPTSLAPLDLTAPSGYTERWRRSW